MVTPALVLMTDFGLKDGAVSAMKGVAYETAPNLLVSDLTHEVPPYNIWEASFRLVQTYKYWPKGTVFVTVIDPGVGSERHSIVMRSKSGHYFVGPDNGLYTLVADQDGVDEVRIIDESKQRLKGSADSYTFHGRDLYVYVGARLASGQLKFEDSGESAGQKLTKIPYQKAVAEKGELRVPTGKPLLYFNSLLNLSLALNQGDFAKANKIGSGPTWTLAISAPK
ncbi:MAG: hypothetical protein EOP05_18685 [Proteobacteria bacterium]|nr:MAG: hypothetical protein EOP05_18685 [Pseudomonadota bacterium]